MTSPDFRAAVEHEFRRLGLRSDEMPALATRADAQDVFLAHLRRLPGGAAWRDVFPDLPPDWCGWGAPRPYRPRGTYDYPPPPAGPAVHLQWPDRGGDPGRFDALVAAARAAGHRVYSAGLVPVTNPQWRTLDAIVVLERGTSEDALSEFLAWVDEQPAVRVAAVPRTGSDAYTA